MFHVTNEIHRSEPGPSLYMSQPDVCMNITQKHVQRVSVSYKHKAQRGDAVLTNGIWPKISEERTVSIFRV
jgi:hypothetical protein